MWEMWSLVLCPWIIHQRRIRCPKCFVPMSFIWMLQRREMILYCYWGNEWWLFTFIKISHLKCTVKQLIIMISIDSDSYFSKYKVRQFLFIYLSIYLLIYFRYTWLYVLTYYTYKEYNLFSSGSQSCGCTWYGVSLGVYSYMIMGMFVPQTKITFSVALAGDAVFFASWFWRTEKGLRYPSLVFMLNFSYWF